MKKALLIFAVLFSVILTSCNKEEVAIPLNDEAIRAQVMSAPVPAIGEFVAFAEGTRLKAATMDEGPLPIVMVFPLDARTILISGNKATKFFLLYKFQGNVRTQEITISQQFNIGSDGKIDPNSGGLQEAIPGCPFKAEFFIAGEQRFQNVRLSCNFKDGRQITFSGTLNGNMVKLPPLDGGVWQLLLGFHDDDMYQEFLTYPINFYGQTNEVKLKIEIGKDNIKSYIQIPKKYLVDANYIQIFTENVETGEITSYAEFNPIYDEALLEYVVYGVPFLDTNRVNIYGNSGRMSLLVRQLISEPINGKPVFRAMLPIVVNG